MLVSKFLSTLYILDFSSLLDMGLVKFFSYSVGYCSVILTVYFALQKHFIFMRSYLLIVYLSAWTNGVLLRKLSRVTMFSSLFLIWPMIIFRVYIFMSRFLIHLDLSFGKVDKYRSFCILLQVDMQFDQNHLLKMLFFSLVWFGLFVKTLLSVGMWFYFWVFYLILLIKLSILYKCHAIFITISQ